MEDIAQQTKWIERLYAEGERLNVPSHTLKTLVDYVANRVPTGGFLHAVLTNDLIETMGRADHINREHIHDICSFVYNWLPANCWHSEEAVKRWLERKE